MFARLLVCFIATVVVFTSSNSADDFPGMPFVDNPGSDMSEYSGSIPFVPSGESSSEQVQPPPSQTEDTVFKPVATDSVYWRRLPWVPKLTSDGSLRFWLPPLRPPHPWAPFLPFPPRRPPRVVIQPPKRTPPSTKLWLFPPFTRPSPHTRPHRPPPPPMRPLPSARLPPVWTLPPPPPLTVQPPTEPPVPIDPPIPTEPPAPAPAPKPPLVNPPEGYPLNSYSENHKS